MSRPPADYRANRLRAALKVEGEDGHCCDTCADHSKKLGKKVSCQDNVCSILPMKSDSITKPLSHKESVMQCVADLKENGEIDPNDPRALAGAYGACSIRARGIVRSDDRAARLESILNERPPNRRRRRPRPRVQQQQEAAPTPVRPPQRPRYQEVALPPVPQIESAPAPAPEPEPQPFNGSGKLAAAPDPALMPVRELREQSDAFKAAEAAKAFSQLDAQAEALCEDTAATKRAYTCRPMRFFETRGMLAGDVLDYGSGRDPHDCARYDPVYAPRSDVLQRQWSTVTCNYVLDIVEQDGHRVGLMLALKQLVKPEGRCLLSIRQPVTEDEDAERGRWDEFVARFWPRSTFIEDDTPGFWAWELRHEAPSALTEQQKVEPPRTKENIVVGPFTINVPEREVKIESPVNVQAPEVTVNTPEIKPEINVSPEINVPELPAPKVDVNVDVPKQDPPVVNIDKGAVQVNVEAPKAPTKTIHIKRDGKGGVTGTLEPKEDSEPDDMPESMKRMLGK